MSTRCNIHFSYGKDTVSNIYRHSDGYPEGVVPDLTEFFTDVKAECKDTRFGDPSYLAAKYVVWQAQAFAVDYDFSGSGPIKVKPKASRLDFRSLGVMTEDAGDAEYIYNVDCNKHDADGFPVVTYKKP